MSSEKADHNDRCLGTLYFPNIRKNIRFSTLNKWVVVLAIGLFVVTFLVHPHAAQAWTRVGDHLKVSYATPEPYGPSKVADDTVVWEQIVSYPDASYITVHFDRFELAPGDYLELTDPFEYYHHHYSGGGYLNKGGDFWALSVTGDTMILRLHARGKAIRHGGISIDMLAHGFPLKELEHKGDKALCGTEDFKDVACYQSSYPQEYDKSRAVVKLLKNGVSHCTGWLVSCENHMLTNEHCVSSQSELDQIEFQFMYQRPSCGSGTPTYELQLQGGTFLKDNSALDYCLLKPNLNGNDPQSTYGFIQIDNRTPAIDEIIYIPGHPSGDPKRLSLESTHAQDQSGRCEIYSLNETPCAGGSGDLGYYCDTEGGSSGSPVLSAISHKAIGLHHCAYCPNRAVPITAVYSDIQNSSTPLPACSTCNPGPPSRSLNGSAPAPNVIRLTWASVNGAAKYHVYRSRTDCDTDLTEIAVVSSGSGNTYDDTTVSGSLTYYYRVTVENDCGAESVYSPCATVTATGNCVERPQFSGISSTTSQSQSVCTIDLAWNAATTECGNTVVYHVYWSTVPGFTPSASNEIAACISGTSYQHVGAFPGMNYYVVRAENDSPFGTGSCFNGMMETNTNRLGVFAHGPGTTGTYFDDMEKPEPNGWSHTAAQGTDDWAYTTNRAYSATHSWFSADVAGFKDAYLVMPEKYINSSTQLSFFHYYDTESGFDGAVLEISTDGGNQYTDLGAYIIQNGYNGSISTSFNSPLAGRNAWTGSSGASFIETKVDLSSFSGLNALIRFRLACDSSVSSDGWYIDDVTMTNTSTFGPCSAQLPTLNVWGMLVLLCILGTFLFCYLPERP